MREPWQVAWAHPGTALPGGSGNVGFAGHRDTFFRALHKIRLGDDILVTTPAGLLSIPCSFARNCRP